MKTILIIDDDACAAAVLEGRFRASGYTTVVAGATRSALALAFEEHPALVVIDISQPGGSGLELARTLRAYPSTRTVPVILLTASKDPEVRGTAMELGAAGFFDKPYDPGELLAVASHAMGETGRFQKAPSEPSPRPPIASARSAPKTVVIVEDDSRIAMALSLRLKSAGYQTLVAGDALSGMRTVLDSNPDLVLLDISMPAGNGFTLAERLKKVLPNPVPVIFLTASKQPEFRARARQLGAAGYFEKPYEAADLLAAVGRQIGT